ncbi:MAG: RNA polymerase sigma factor [Gammaproteobacteria bacterium]|nr:RNA polymerase sigma factor [Gammaproteobacteria bacterium]NIR85620.1 RNA polymerase sigma factor [Gammaproteobacteria bacterium]NIR90108.1 RNA polymerase sigma factor [Gammaproteobacteria bacterium]NIU06754.1 RNA polymerase sigma factor [Gammaproteobacteria bacterium]NIV53687.1 sigma-70 family RNA polymerase sigma factor [Gammaproteobacteria bacterium]
MAESGLDTVLARHREAVRGFVLRLVRDEVLADDLTQETFVHAQRSDSPCRDRGAEQGWLYSIALNVVRDHFRAQKRAPKEAQEDAWPADPPSTEDLEREVMQKEMSACILEYLDTVPSPQQELLVLHDMVGLKHAEIGKILNISEANSRVQLHRARSLFRSILEKNCALSFNGDPIPCERLPAKKSG